MGSIYLHIGPHKTGSTYIQKQLCLNRGWLRQNGFAYPELAQDQWGHHKIVTWIKRRDHADLADLKAGLERLYRQVGNVVISSENFDRLTTEEVGMLKELLGESAVRVIYYARRWPKLLYSTWQENVKNGATATLPEFLSLHLMRPVSSPMLNYAVRLDPYKRVFGKEAIDVISYDNLLAEDDDIFRHFTSTVLGLAHGGELTSEKINASLRPERVEILRALNTVHFSRGGDRDSLPRRGFLGDETRGFPSPDKLLEAMQPHRKSIKVGDGAITNAMILRRFLSEYGDRILNPSEAGGLFKDGGDAKLDYVGQDYLLGEGVSSMLHAMYVTVMKSAAAGNPESFDRTKSNLCGGDCSTDGSIRGRQHGQGA